MTRHRQTLGVVVLVIAFGASVGTQEQSAGKPPEKPPVITPLKVQIVLSRYRGEKKISSMPYALSVNTNAPRFAQLRMGAQVPVPVMATPTVDGKEIQGVLKGGPVQYKDIGTSIDCLARSTSDGRFQLELTIEDTSVYTDDQVVQGAPKAGDNPTFRSFRSSNTLVLKDGQSTQFTTATDRISGEVVKVDVTLTVVK
jgi:hypothetical protein